MKSILVPTDFSENAKNALNLALILAKQQKARITLLNVFEIPAAAAPISPQLISEERDQKLRDQNIKLHTLAGEMKLSPEQGYECIALEGGAVETIVRFAKEKQPDLIVMGTKGERGVSDFLFGSITSDVIERTDCPVLAVPQGVNIEAPIERITYASNFLNSDLPALKILSAIARPMNASVTILHIADGDVTQEEEVRKMGEFIQKVSSAVPYGRFGFELINGDDVENELEEYIRKEKTDLMVLSTKYRNFFARLLEVSTTKEILESSPVPVIAFHHRRQNPVNIY